MAGDSRITAETSGPSSGKDAVSKNGPFVLNDIPDEYACANGICVRSITIL